MAQENQLYLYTTKIEYFSTILLEQEDEWLAIYIIMYLVNHIQLLWVSQSSDEDETLGHFICYLLYEKQVSQVGNIRSKNDWRWNGDINHRAILKKKLLLFDEYYEDTTKLQPFMYKKQEETLSEKTLIELKQSGIKFEENVEKQRQFISELQERAEKYKPEKTQTTMNSYYKFISYTFSILDGTSHRRELQTNKIA